MVRCSNCKTPIEFHYCPKCGQEFRHKKITLFSLIKDIFDNLFSFDRSFLQNIKLMFLNPGKIVTDYWEGFRRYYFSPSRFFLIASIFLSIALLLTENTFLGLRVNAENMSSQFAFFIFFIPLISISSYLAYLGLRRSLIEHIVLNIYNSSFWMLPFTLLSVLLTKMQITALNYPVLVLYILLVTIWNARVFSQKGLAFFFRLLLNLLIFFLIIGLLVILFLELSSR